MTPLRGSIYIFKIYNHVTSSRLQLNKKSFIVMKDLGVSTERIELSTNGLKGRCSTIELRAHYLLGGLHSITANYTRQHGYLY